MGVASRLFRVLTTESMSALLLLSAVAITQAKNPCEGMRFDDCRIEEDMIIDRFDFNADQCEASCKLSDTCTYWRHYEYESDSQDVLPCLHMISDYRQDCFSFAGPVDGDIDSCLNTFSYTCTAYFEDVCHFNGTRLEDQEPKPHDISSIRECQEWARIAESMGAAYFFYDGDTEECQLFSSMEPSCSAIGGPETAPPLDQCKGSYPLGCSGDKCVEECGPGWEKYGNRCYLWSIDKKTWAEAEDFCKTEGGHLASVSSSAIRDYVKQGSEKNNLDNVWTGGNDIDEEGTWKWTDCTPWEFTSWASGEPNNMGNVQDCLRQSGRINSNWDDYSCSNTIGFVCNKMIC